jgi:DNA-binding transcriptional regulator YdaS (Cro superfamily)
MSTPGASERHRVRGFDILVENSRADIRTSDVLSRLDEALALIDEVQPWRLRHLRRDLQGFWIVRFACRGAYFPDERACMTELTFLNRRDISAAPVAASIIHENARASTAWACGGRVATAREAPVPARRTRVRRRSASAGAPVVERALASSISRPDVAPVVDWRDAERRIDAVDREALGGG